MKKQKFALLLGNRSIFPGELIAIAQRELKDTIEKLGFEIINPDSSITKNGAVETVEDGIKYASFLKDNQSKYDGIILSLPNFGDENGAIAALNDCNTPIFIHAYSDEIGKMDPTHRRDAFCGKLSIMNILYQHKVPYTAFKPHTVSPDTKEFEKNIKDFAAVCRIVKKSKNVTLGAIGARTTPFKTVRFDELTLQRNGINVETIDMSEIFLRVKSIKDNSKELSEKIKDLINYSDFSNIPKDKLSSLSKLSLAVDGVISDYKIDCLTLRCWLELQREYGISPCVLLSELNNKGIIAACETDACNAVAMYILSAASQGASACLDWNNNYEGINDKCILFHCGSTAQTLMEEKGKVIDHKLVPKDVAGWGCNIGVIAKGQMTFSSSKTENGVFTFYLGEGEFTGEHVDKEYFGCYGVVKIDNLQNILLGIGKNGFNHHVSVTKGHHISVIKEAFNSYLGYEIIGFD